MKPQPKALQPTCKLRYKVTVKHFTVEEVRRMKLCLKPVASVLGTSRSANQIRVGEKHMWADPHRRELKGKQTH